MAILKLSTLIAAPRERVFDLARSIDAHQKSTGRTRERAIAGVTTGLIGLNEEVTWEAFHFGIKSFRLPGRDFGRKFEVCRRRIIASSS